MEEMGEFSIIFQFFMNSLTTTSSNRLHPARVRVSATDIAIDLINGGWFVEKLLFSLLGGFDHRTRHGCLRWLSLIKGHPTARSTITQQSTGLTEYVTLMEVGQGSFIWPISPILYQLRDSKICWAGQEILNWKNNNHTTINHVWFKFAMVMHCMTGMYPSDNGRAYEILHPQILQ